jgi:triacylglycerol lipase
LPFLFSLGCNPHFPHKIGVSLCCTDWGAAPIPPWIAEQFFTARDYEVHRLAYPSTKEDLGQLGEQIRSEAQGLCPTTPNFLTHSMGGIILRVIKSTHPDFAVARVVMLGPPNNGSEIVDEWWDWKLFVQLNGPAGARLGRDGIVTELPNVEFDLGIIAGSRSLNPYYSHLITGPDDGKVSIEATNVAGMQDHIVLPVTHTFMMNSGEVLNQALHFFQNGYFRKE